MNIPGLVVVTKDDEFGWYYSQPIAVSVLGDHPCRIAVEDYDGDPRKEEFHSAIVNFLSINTATLKDSEKHIYQYYKDCNDDLEPDDEAYIAIKSPSDVWAHIQLGQEPTVSRRAYGDKGIYVSIECNCDWEIEHGLQIVFKNGSKINKIGPYDGHLTNSDAYDDDSLESVIYSQP